MRTAGWGMGKPKLRTYEEAYENPILGELIKINLGGKKKKNFHPLLMTLKPGHTDPEVPLG